MGFCRPLSLRSLGHCLQDTWDQHRHRTPLQSVCAAAYLVCPQVGVVFFAVFVVSVLGHVPGAKVEKFQTEIITLPGGRPDWFNNAGSYYYFTSATNNVVALLLLLLVLQKVGNICASCVGY